MPTVIETIILDLDGPLLDGQLRHYQCYRDILAEKGFVPMSLAQYWDMKRHRVDRRRQLAVSDAERLYDEFLDAWLARIESKPYLALDRLQEGATAKLREWKTAGIYLLLATMRRHRDNLFWQLETLGLHAWFDEIIVVESTDPAFDKASKIRPYLKDRVFERALWIGDTEVDVEAARRLGVKICAVSCGLRTTDYLASLKPDFLLSDVDSIRLADLAPQ